MTDSETGQAIVIGASGGIGSALVEALAVQGWTVTGLSRRSDPPLDLLDEASIAAAAETFKTADPPVRLIIDATGFVRSTMLLKQVRLLFMNSGRRISFLDPLQLGVVGAISSHVCK